MKTCINIRHLLVGLTFLVLVGCQLTEQRLQELTDEIGLPPDAALLSAYIQENQGSQDSCYSTSLLELYGSDLAIEEIAQFYAAELVSQGWKEYTPSWLPSDDDETHLLFRKGNTAQVALSEATPFVIDQFGESAQAAAQLHETVYAVTWTYPDAIARLRCPAWQADPETEP